MRNIAHPLMRLEFISTLVFCAILQSFHGFASEIEKSVSLEEMKRLIETYNREGWPTLGVKYWIKQIKGYTSTEILLFLAREASRVPAQTGVLKVENHDIYLTGNYRLRIYTTDKGREWLLSNLSPLGERMGEPIPHEDLQAWRKIREREIEQFRLEARRERERKIQVREMRRTERETINYPVSSVTSEPIYLFPNPYLFSFIHRAVDHRCGSISHKPVDSTPGPHGRVPPLNTPTRPHGTWNQ